MSINEIIFQHKKELVVSLYNIDIRRFSARRQNMEYQRDEHRMHFVAYHIVWCPRRRKPVLIGDIAKDLRKLIETKCDDNGWEILDLKIAPEHVHLFVRVFPTTPALFVVNQCKGASSGILRSKYPDLMKIPSLWTSSYLASTENSVPQELIQKFIEIQKGI